MGRTLCLRWSWLLPAGFAALSFVLLLHAQSPSRPSHRASGPVIGVIDGVRYETDRYYVYGWACQQGNTDSIDVHVYADHPAGAERFVTVGRADLGSEPAVGKACEDALGKHRFRVELSNQLLRTYRRRKLYVHGIAVAGNVGNPVIAGSGDLQFPDPKWPVEPHNPNFIDGPRVTVFDTAKDSCEKIDIPDEQARAFRDYKGTIHLFASHYVVRANLGPTLESVKHNCQVVFKSHGDGNPANFDDNTWLNSFYNIDGKRIVALGHMEYHAWEHPGMCKPNSDPVSCSYVADTFFLSEDGGYHFASPKAPANFVLGPPYKYEINQGIEGYSVDTNIVRVGEWYYAMVVDWPWPPNCDNGDKTPRCLLPWGASPIRTSNILDPGSWRGWNGKDFSVTFVNPYLKPVARPQDHVYTPVEVVHPVNHINYYEPSHQFIATLWNPENDEYGTPGLYFSTSPDMVHWSKPALGITVNQLLQSEPEGNWSYMYFSLIDPKSSDPNFSTVGDSPYLYYVRLDDNHGPYQRVLFRQKIKLDWLVKPGRNSTSTSSPN